MFAMSRRKKSVRICMKSHELAAIFSLDMAHRDNNNLIAKADMSIWQTSNEYECHETTYMYPASKQTFGENLQLSCKDLAKF